MDFVIKLTLTEVLQIITSVIIIAIALSISIFFRKETPKTASEQPAKPNIVTRVTMKKKTREDPKQKAEEERKKSKSESNQPDLPNASDITKEEIEEI